MDRIVAGSALAAAALLAGCTSGTALTSVDVSDHNVFVPSARVSFDIGRGRAERPSELHEGSAIELEASTAKGTGGQSLGPGALPILFAGQSFNGPQQLSSEFDFKYAGAAWRWRRFFGDGRFGFEALAGLAIVGLDVTFASPSQRAQRGLDSSGGIVGVGLLWRIRPSTSAQARLTWYGSPSGDDVSRADRLDLHLVQALGRHAAVRVGYSAWDLRTDMSSPPAFSNVNVRFAGPALGLELMF